MFCIKINDRGRVVVADTSNNENEFGQVRRITFPTATMPTSSSDAYGIDQNRPVIVDVEMNDGRSIQNVQLSIR